MAQYLQRVAQLRQTASQDNWAVVNALVSIGVNDAVAVDGSDSVLLGEHSQAWFTPGDLKKVWLRYGFSCGGK